MKNFAVLGLGLMGKAICFDLLTFTTNHKIFGFELQEDRRKALEDEFSNFSERFSSKKLSLEIKTDVLHEPLVQELKDLDIKVVFGAIDYKYNEYLTKVCITAGCSLVDLGGNPDIVHKQQQLDELAKQAQVTIIPDLGLAPGMAGIIASAIMQEFTHLDECHIRVGGLPQKPETILKYQQVFSIRGLTNEYLEDAFVIRNGQISTVESLTELEELEFPNPWGKLEAFQTSGGTSNLPTIYEGKIRELTYKTIRFPGHCQFFQFLKDFELLTSDPFLDSSYSPREVIEHFLTKHLPNNKLDAVLVRITVKGVKKDTRIEVVMDLIDMFDTKTKYSSMARTTAFPTSIIGQMIMNNIITKKGVLFGETNIPFTHFINELSKRDIIFKRTEISI